jgi:hypothetical protein
MVRVHVRAFLIAVGVVVAGLVVLVVTYSPPSATPGPGPVVTPLPGASESWDVDWPEDDGDRRDRRRWRPW